jgi:outer membrane murein-binding lipoprotein Lpp
MTSASWDPSTTPDGPRAPGPPGRRRAGRGAVVTAVVLAVLLLLVTVTAAYLWRTTLAWEDRADRWESAAREQAAGAAALQTNLDGVSSELAASRDQLDTATARITELADEKAQLGDENVVSQQYLDYQRRVSEAAGAVATALGQCIRSQAELIGYLEEPEAYDPADLERFAGDVQALCDQANDANEQLQQELTQ